MVSRVLWTALAMLAVCALASCAADDEDNKPYKFGFNIEKYQHRLEEKNKKGLIKGEFGFVTGDGVYHETAYATDENGDFKILGMRSYFVGLPGLDLPDITKGSKPAAPAPAPAPVPASKPQPLAPTILSGIMGCSSCIIPDSTSTAQQSGTGASAGSPGSNGNGPFSRPPSAFGGPGGPGSAVGPGGSVIGDRNPQSKPSYTQVDAAHSNIKVGGFSPEEMLALLYRFNYTLGFHGHHEVGDRAGHKQGGYHFDGRDGLERRVQYTANEYGFQPNITLHELSAADTPRADTERNAEHGLKGYEFVWFNDKKKSAELAAAAARRS
ncbi:Protein lethal(3)malignant blood neoplasm 1 [Frankliniella fusca]|uniref:Protein lethal(3)malignant blood neoplasm 1 n=1 Tax=Frankliniella fusca TaxID=407009 RepID=A0AAE1LLL5_9NEOP|nr:Protein lethal(3)malignant blood neoplasm 1 [Frankliniella fusca]